MPTTDTKSTLETWLRLMPWGRPDSEPPWHHRGLSPVNESALF